MFIYYTIERDILILSYVIDEESSQEIFVREI